MIKLFLFFILFPVTAFASDLIPLGMDAATGLLKIMTNTDRLILGAAAGGLLSASAIAVGLINGGTLAGNNSGDQVLPTIPALTTSSFTLSASGTGATGTQVSSTKWSMVSVNYSTSTTATIGAAATSSIVLKTCATNSATETDWATVATFESDQTVTLAIVLNSIQVVKGQLIMPLNAGTWIKAEAIGTGTHTEAFLAGSKTIYG